MLICTPARVMRIGFLLSPPYFWAPTLSARWRDLPGLRGRRVAGSCKMQLGNSRGAAGKPSTGRFSYTRPSNPFLFQQNKTGIPNGIPVFFGCRIGIRTPTNRVRVCRATVTQFGNVPRTHYSIASTGAFVKIFFKKIENFPSLFFRVVKKSQPPFTKMHKCGKIISY